MPIQQQTPMYKTWVKETLVDALRGVFAIHPDETTVRNTKITIEMPVTQVEYPAIVIRFYERELTNAGVGHHEWVDVLDDAGDPTGTYARLRHYLYTGDIEFGIYALSSHDRDIISDALFQVLAFGDTEDYSASFYDKIYRTEAPLTDARWQGNRDHAINLNSDRIQPYGETESMAPWQPEDVLVYQVAYRLGISGSFYSRMPEETATGLVEQVDAYPYNEEVGEPVPDPNPDDPAPWIGNEWIYS